MEPDIMPLHSSSPPPLDDGGEDDDDDGDVGLEEDEFGDFGGFSVVVTCSPLDFAHSTEPMLKPAPPQPSYSFNHPVEQSQPASSVNSGSDRGQIDVKGQGYNASLHLANGYSKKEHDHYSASLEDASSPKEETGFADFTVFNDQAAHPWCCGFPPISSTDQWGEKVEEVNLSQKICDAGQEVILDSEPRSHCAHKEKGDVYTKARHCEERERPFQDHYQPQGAAAALDFQPAEPRLWEEDEGKSVNCWKESGHCLHESEDYREAREDFSNVPRVFSMYDTTSEDLGSFGDDFSFEGVSADLEPNVSSLNSHEDQTDWDKTDDEDEELGNYKLADLVNNSTEELRQTEGGNALNVCKQSATQETPTASNLFRRQFDSVANTEGQYSHFNPSSFEHQQGQARADVRVENLATLPASDSFADFCSAPTQEDGDGSWAEFKEQRTQEESEPCTRLTENVSRLQTDGDSDEERDQARQFRFLRRNSCQASLLNRVQQLLLDSFPEAVVTATDHEEELLSLDALLHNQHLSEREEGEITDLSRDQWKQRGLWWPQQDIQSAIGLQFQWKGSHANSSLLSCLGVDTRNIVFIGLKKQPVTVPAVVSGLQGFLEPTKDSVPAIRSSQYPAVAAQTPPGPRDRPGSSTASVQGALPSRQLGWSSRGLSSSQDGTSPCRAPHFWGLK